MEIKGGGADRVNILTFGALALKNYTGTAMTADTPQESEGQLIINQKKAFYFKIQSWTKFASYAEDPTSVLIQDAGKVLKETIDGFVLGSYGDVGSGNRVGTDYTTGTVAVAVTTGVVTGTGTTFTAGMVGLGFKATGHSVWYRVKTFTDTTHIVIEDDKDDEASAYTGGAISAGATYIVEANTKVQVSKTTLYGKILDLKMRLDQNKVPMGDRSLVLNAHLTSVLLQTSELIPAVASAYEDVVKRGLVGMVAGFTVYQSEQLSGNNTDGYIAMAMHKSWFTLAIAFTESGVEDLIGDFGKAYKGLTCYGGKVLDNRRKAGALGKFYV